MRYKHLQANNFLEMQVNFMKICFSWESIVPFNKGAHGDMSQVLGMLKGLADQGHQVHFVCLHSGDIPKLGEVIVHQVPDSASSLPKDQKLMNYIVKLHQLLNFDIFHFRSQNLVLLAKKHFPNKPCCYTMVPYYFITQSKSDLEREQRVIDVCDKVVVFTRKWKSYYLKTFSGSVNKLVLIRVGVDKDIFNDVFDRQDSLRSQSVIGYFGGIREDYGLESILKVMSALRQDKANKWSLIIGGTGNKNYMDGLSKLVQHLKVQDAVKFIGYIPRNEIPNYLSKCSVAVNLRHDKSPGKIRGFDYSIPIKVIEYMLAGVPVVASKDGGMVELLGSNYPFLVDPNNIEETASAIKKITLDKELARMVKLENKQKAAYFLNTNVIKDYTSMYQALLKEKKN